MVQRIDGIRDQARILEHRTAEWLADELSVLVQPESGRWIPDSVQSDIATLVAAIDSLVSDLKELRAGLPDDAREHDSVFETELVGRRLSETSDLCRRWTEEPDEPQTVFWLEQNRVGTGSGHVRFVTTPLDITPMMKEALYDRFPALVFTSATLAVGGSFRFWSSRIGLAGDEFLLPSPYNFRENVLLAIPSDAPAPTEPGFMDFAGKLIKEVIELSEGRALVLFTSYSMMNEVHAIVGQTLDRTDIPLLRQGDDDRSRLLSRFRQEAASVLFATDSFWQGVDAPGDSLEVLIISRLPFRVPSDPVVQARMEDIRSRGGNPFLDMSLPDAVIRLRQGFGRLMRRTTDFGAVIILDSRIVTKQYGRAFLSSLPETYKQVGRSEKILLDVEDFLAEKHAAAVQSEKEPPPSPY
jgi:ATP-dependent DNA helicase DinG